MASGEHGEVEAISKEASSAETVIIDTVGTGQYFISQLT